MRYVGRVLTVGPQATKIRTSQEELERQLKAYKRTHESKAHVRTRSVFKSIRIFLLGTSAPYVKPTFTAKDCFFIVAHLQLNLRFMAYYIDLSLEWGGFLVWVVFSATNILLCTGLAFMYTWFGDYGTRTFLGVWDMNPFFQGISMCMFFWETIKMIETGLIISSGLMSIYFVPKLAEKNDTDWVSDYNCSSPDRFVFKPGWAVPYGISKEFTDLGFNKVSNDYWHWRYDAVRGQKLAIIWLVVIIIRIFRFKRYRIMPVRIIPILFYLMLLILFGALAVVNTDPAISVVRSNAYTNLFAYLQIFAFSISDYLPSHWVTIGYLHPTMSQSQIIWGITFMKICAGFMIYFAIPYFAQSFREYVHVTNDNCLHFFGIHFMFIMLPLGIFRISVKYLGMMVYLVFVFLIMLNSVTYLVLNLEMLAVTINLKSSLMHRFQNLIYICACLVLYAFSQLLSMNSVHHMLFHLNFRSHYYTSGILLILTMLGIAIYGLERMNADHHFFFGCAYKHLNATKLLVMVCTCLSAVYALETAIFQMEREAVHELYWIVLGICLAPFIIGIFNSVGHRKSYHGYFHPLTTWGRPQEIVRVGRRRKDLRWMFIYRTKRVCNHDCLLNHEVLMLDVKKEIEMRKKLLNEVLDLQNLLLDNDSSEG